MKLIADKLEYDPHITHLLLSQETEPDIFDVLVKTLAVGVVVHVIPSYE